MPRTIRKIMNKLGVYKRWKQMVMVANKTISNHENVNVNGDVTGLENVHFEGGNGISERCEFSGEISIGYATTLGKNNIFHGNIQIGRYCQVGADVGIHATNHPIEYMSTYINQKLFKGELKRLKQEHRVEIGNDVWIGHNAMIIGNVKVGNGVIIAAGAVVTKDVPSYSIVGGVPANIIKKRFCDNVIKELETLQWWNKNEYELEKIKPLFLKNLTQLKSIYEEGK